MRARGHDYTRGAYFVTMRVHGYTCPFGDVVNGRSRASAAGRMVMRVWRALPNRFPTVALDAVVVMPNHVHGILDLRPDGADAAPTLSSVIGAFKSLSTVEYIRGVRDLGWETFAPTLWQRGFHDHVITGDVDRLRIRRYVAENPAMWTSDSDRPPTRG